MPRFLRKAAIALRRFIVSLEPTSKMSKRILVAAYTFVLVLFGRYQKRKRSAVRVIKNNLPPEDAENQKKINQIYNEILYCRFMYQINAKEYFTYQFEKLSHTGRKLYLTRGNKYRFYRKFNNPNYLDYFNMKTETYRKFSQYYKRDVLPIYSEEDYPAFLVFVGKHKSFIYKPSDDYGGHGVKIYRVEEYESLEDLFKILVFKGYCVLEELIRQSDEIARIHPQSVNTTRVVAFRRDDGEVMIQWAFFRMGMGGSHTDNMSGGGLGSMVDPETGILYEEGRDYLGKVHLFHPDTNVKIIGLQLPEWDQLRMLVKELSNVVPQVRLVGWDFAYSEKGWDFVEANSRPQCLTAQITTINGRLHQYLEIEEIFDQEGIEYAG
ncbi:sugar-transfer associated ATP-grasp domain-containing protein [Enterococcus olivae]